VTVILVLLGGAVGAPLRYLTDLVVQSRHDSVLPWGTLSVNVLGSLVLGGIAALVAQDGAPDWLLVLVGTGLCGAFTTFSTFSYETVRLVQDGSWLHAGLNVALGLTLGLAAVSLGWAVVAAWG
jgi:CrcB protein